MWKTVNRVPNKEIQSKVLLNINKDGGVLKKYSDMPEAANHHFASIGAILPKQITSKPSDDCLKHGISVNSKVALNTIYTK